MSLPGTSSVGTIAEELPQNIQLEAASSSSSASSPILLYDFIGVSCFARVPRCYYPAISLVCKNFRRLIASPEIYLERSLIRRTEHVLYVALRSQATKTLRWYTLNLKPFGTTTENETNHRLVPIPSFPSIPESGSTTISSGYEIYVIGGCINDEPVSNVSVIDCRSHTCRFLPNMKQPRKCAAAGFIDGKLYVVGGCTAPSLNWVEVFDFKTQTWETILEDVNGLEDQLEGLKLWKGLEDYAMVDLGGRLVTLYKKSPTEIWCRMYPSVREERGNFTISGIHLSSNLVLTLTDCSFIERALAVTV